MEADWGMLEPRIAPVGKHLQMHKKISIEEHYYPHNSNTSVHIRFTVIVYLMHDSEFPTEDLTLRHEGLLISGALLHLYYQMR